MYVDIRLKVKLPFTMASHEEIVKILSPIINMFNCIAQPKMKPIY